MSDITANVFYSGSDVRPVDPRTAPAVANRSIGELIREMNGLSNAQIDQIAAYQRQHKTRFGEAALALKLASMESVLLALSQQFRYSYAPHLAGKGVNSELIVATHPFSDEAEYFRELRSQLLMGVMGAEQPRTALVVLSPDVGDGKSYVAANLAVSLSQLGARTVLIDADMRTPRQHQLFGVQRQSGLSDALSGRSANLVMHQVEQLPGLYLLPVGAIPPNPLELAQGLGFSLLIRRMLDEFDHVVVDTPAVVHGADACVLAAGGGAALIVGRKNHTKMSSIQALIQRLGRAKTAIGGVVLNEC